MTSLFLGTIQNPLTHFNSPYGDVGSDTGPVTFISNLLMLVSVGAGIFAFINLLLAGIQYIGSAGKPENTSAAMARINMSLVGLAIIAGANALAAIFGQILFGSWDAILNPQIYGPGVN